MNYEEITKKDSDKDSPTKMQNKPDYQSEQAMKENWDYVDDRVAQFADQLLVDHKDNVERGGTSRHDVKQTEASNRNWAHKLGYVGENEP